MLLDSFVNFFCLLFSNCGFPPLRLSNLIKAQSTAFPVAFEYLLKTDRIKRKYFPLFFLFLVAEMKNKIFFVLEKERHVIILLHVSFGFPTHLSSEREVLFFTDNCTCRNAF